MRVAEANESPRPAEPELMSQRDGVRLAAERTSRLATRKELEAEGTAVMDAAAKTKADAMDAGMETGGTERSAKRCQRDQISNA